MLEGSVIIGVSLLILTSLSMLMGEHKYIRGIRRTFWSKVE